MSVHEGFTERITAVGWGGKLMRCSITQGSPDELWTFGQIDNTELLDVARMQKAVTGSLSGAKADLSLIPKLAYDPLSSAFAVGQGPFYDPATGAIITTADRPIVGYRFYPIVSGTRLGLEGSQLSSLNGYFVRWRVSGNMASGETATLKLTRNDSSAVEEHDVTTDGVKTAIDLAEELHDSINAGSIATSSYTGGDDFCEVTYPDDGIGTQSLTSTTDFFRVQISNFGASAPQSTPADPGWQVNDEI